MSQKLKQRLIAVAFFGLGLFVMAKYAEITDAIHRIECGDKRGWTTHVTYDLGMAVCVWRENSYPYRTISGIKV